MSAIALGTMIVVYIVSILSCFLTGIRACKACQKYVTRSDIALIIMVSLIPVLNTVLTVTNSILLMMNDNWWREKVL